MGSRIKTLIIIVGLLIFLIPHSVVAQPQQLLISQIKTGGMVEGEPNEFVVLSNISDESVDLSGWIIEYAKSSALIADCDFTYWKEQDSSSNVRQVELNGTIEAYGSVIIELNMNDNQGGSLHLVKDDKVIDKVGWGDLSSLGVCYQGALATVPKNGDSIVRKQDSAGNYIISANNAEDFILASKLNQEQNDTPSDISDEQSCKNIELSEILPNPSGVDTDKEYIELYNNSTQVINLNGCSLQVGSNIKQLSGDLHPGYKVFYGQTLPNAAGGQVTLITLDIEEVVNYPADMKDDESWSKINGQWQLTNQPTPNIANKASAVVVESIASTTQQLLACPSGKYRNPATNRCKNIEVVASNNVCQPGQVRNPATNRCKKISTVNGLLKSCAVDQVRNPATNRCKKVTNAKALAQCKPGQERNPATNRCKKAVASASTSKPNNFDDKNNKKNINYAVLSIIALAVVGYGAYEYRDSLSNYFVKLRQKIKT